MTIDYHEGYLQCLHDLLHLTNGSSELYAVALNEVFLKPAIKIHTDKIGEILEDMYKVYNKDK